MSTLRTVLLLHGVGSSSDTWWRTEEDLGELGWETLALDLAGHGDRPVPAGGLHTMSDLADDVLAQVGDRCFDLLVGHSLGAIVALDLAAAHPELAAQVVIVDPPALGGALKADDVATSLAVQSAQAHDDLDAVSDAVAAQDPRWSPIDSAGVARNSLRMSPAVPEFLRELSWDLPALVVDCPVPLSLIVADGPETATVEPGRGRVLEALAPDRVVAIRGGHGLHRDRPALFLRALLHLVDGH